MLGFLFTLLATLSFGLLGLLGKVAERKNCRPAVVTLVLFGSSAVLAGITAAFSTSTFLPPAKIVLLALTFGIMASTGGWVFLYGLRFGKITTSWVIINLSGLVPAAASTVIYGEDLSLKKLILLALVFSSILFLWKDMKEEAATARAKTEMVPAQGANTRATVPNPAENQTAEGDE